MQSRLDLNKRRKEQCQLGYSHGPLLNPISLQNVMKRERDSCCLKAQSTYRLPFGSYYQCVVKKIKILMEKEKHGFKDEYKVTHNYSNLIHVKYLIT